jgi:hypothetical protein
MWKTPGPQKGLGAGGDLPGGLNPHPEIIPAGRGSRREGREVSKVSNSLAISSPICLARLDRRSKNAGGERGGGAFSKESKRGMETCFKRN